MVHNLTMADCSWPQDNLLEIKKDDECCSLSRLRAREGNSREVWRTSTPDPASYDEGRRNSDFWISEIQTKSTRRSMPETM